MAKANITEYSATAASNTEIDGTDISENCSPAGINNAIRELMAHLKDMDAGTTTLTAPKGTNITASTALKTPAIQFTDGDAAITIADGGGVTANNFSSTSVNIDGGAIDGITLGTNSAVTQAVIDNININGTTIGHTSDTDLLTLTSGLLTVAGEVSMTTLDIGGTDVTATAAELNIMDGVTATTSEINIIDGVTATTTEINLLDGVTSTTTELNITDGSTSVGTTAVAGADGIVTNDSGTMRHTSVDTFDTYLAATSKTLTNKTIDADNNTVSNIEVDNLKSGVLDTDLSSVSSSHDTIPSAKATKEFLEASGTAAANSATASATSATASATSATASASSATAAASSATAASTSETNSQTSANSAAASALLAAGAFDSFDDKYLGTMADSDTASSASTTGTFSSGGSQITVASASGIEVGQLITGTNIATGTNVIKIDGTTINISEATTGAGSGTSLTFTGHGVFGTFNSSIDGPPTDNDGNTLATGMLYFNVTDGEMRVYDGANWIAASASASVSFTKYKYVATASQTTFSGTDANSATLSYLTNNIIVALNGVILDATDFTATNGTSVVLGSGASASDELTIYAFKSFTVADAVAASTGGTFGGNVVFNGTTTGLDLNGTEFILDADGDTSITADTDDQIDIRVAGSDQIKIAAGEVAFNEASGDVDFRIESNGNANMLFVDGGNDAVVIGHNNATNGSFLSGGALQVVGTAATSAHLGISRFSDNAFPPSLFFAKSRSGSIGTDTVVQSGDELGQIGFAGADGTDMSTQGATIKAAVDGTPGGNDMPTRLVFSTTGDGNSSVTERMRVTSGGELLLGTTTAPSGGSIHMVINSSSGGGIQLTRNNNGGSVIDAIDGGGARFFSFTGAVGSESYTERMRIDSSGNVGIGTSSPSSPLTVVGSTTNSSGIVDTLTLKNTGTSADDGAKIQFTAGTSTSGAGIGSGGQALNSADLRFFSGGTSERLRLASDGSLFFAKTAFAEATAGVAFDPSGIVAFTRSTGTVFVINRQSDDGTLVDLRNANSTEGTIGISGSTVSYNGFSGLHESSGIATNVAIGTVVSTIDELDVYPSKQKNSKGDSEEDHPKAGQTRADHAKIKISDSVGDKRVYGVLQSYDDNGKPLVASVGIGSIKVTGACKGGDLLESNGDGTAKVQDDDIVKSKTIGKVTIGNSDTKEKLVSCVLYCG